MTGVGQTEFSSGSGRSQSRLAIEAALLAIADAGLNPGDIDGIIPYQIGPPAEDLIAMLGLGDVRFTAVSHLGGASPVAGLRTASLAIAAGQAEAVLMYVARNGRSGDRVESRVTQQVPGQQFRHGLEHPLGLSLPVQTYSLMCRRHMLDFGTTREQLGKVAVTMREHALLNPHAQMYGRELTFEQYVTSKPIALPYLMFDCSLETDGASAIVITSAERARDLPQPPVLIRGVAEGHADSADDLSARNPIYGTGLAKAAPRAFREAGIGPADVDVALIYDCFTFQVIQQLEAAGFAPLGQGGAFVEAGEIALSGGSLPVNPHGGLLSEGHLAGMNHIVEAVLQLRHAGGDRQVPGAEVAAVTGWGDLGDGSLAVLTN
ncbi:thiolase C-terminal domain-containing protein [Nocardioides halotolerans]|uniref:thiolase C-terminal domain-containing protein n=1 Tax=Nocardioides halotolerans TaxID=433660 RepID=UPI00041820D5|nr:lipid-transfer protein [Nocardioides halotolerans]